MQTLPEKEIMGHIADLFKGFADPTRVHILSLHFFKYRQRQLDMLPSTYKYARGL